MWRRFWLFITRWRRLREIDEEMRLHLELRVAANQRDGLDAQESAREARIRFGNPLALREEVRDVWGFVEFERFCGDLRQALRRVVHRPAPTLVVVLTLALGIGATTAMFSIIDPMFLRPAPWNSTGRLVWIVGLKGRSAGTRNVSYPDYVVYRDRATTLSGVAASGSTAMSIRGAGQPQRVQGALVSGNYFDVLRLRAQVGRTFTPAEDAEPDGHSVVVLSDALWRAHFGGDPQRDWHGGRDQRPPVHHRRRRPARLHAAWPTPTTRNSSGSRSPCSPSRCRAAQASSRMADTRAGSASSDGSAMAPRPPRADAEMRVIARQLNPAGHGPGPERRAPACYRSAVGLTPWEQDGLASIFALVSIAPALVLLVACANVANCS